MDFVFRHRRVKSTGAYSGQGITKRSLVGPLLVYYNTKADSLVDGKVSDPPKGLHLRQAAFRAVIKIVCQTPG